MRRRGRVSEKVYTYLSAVFGDDAAKQYWAFVKKPPTKYIRVNELKINRADLAKRLYDNYGISTDLK
jgi:16S rRNA C967 or C1407 C5-methylase (RsmB/RsmF family)